MAQCHAVLRLESLMILAPRRHCKFAVPASVSLHSCAKFAPNRLQHRAAVPRLAKVYSKLNANGLSEKQRGVEAASLRVFEQHLGQHSDRKAWDVALELLQEVVSTKKVQAQLALGAAVQLESDANSDQGASRPLS